MYLWEVIRNRSDRRVTQLQELADMLKDTPSTIEQADYISERVQEIMDEADTDTAVLLETYPFLKEAL